LICWHEISTWLDESIWGRREGGGIGRKILFKSSSGSGGSPFACLAAFSSPCRIKQVSELSFIYTNNTLVESHPLMNVLSLFLLLFGYLHDPLVRLVSFLMDIIHLLQ